MWKMAGIDNAYLLWVMGKLQRLEVEPLKYVLKDTLTGKINSFTGKIVYQTLLPSWLHSNQKA